MTKTQKKSWVEESISHFSWANIDMYMWLLRKVVVDTLIDGVVNNVSGVCINIQILENSSTRHPDRWCCQQRKQFCINIQILDNSSTRQSNWGVLGDIMLWFHWVSKQTVLVFVSIVSMMMIIDESWNVNLQM